MRIDDTLDILEPIANAIRKDPRITKVFIEYPAYLSVIFGDTEDDFVNFGFNPNEDEETEMLSMSWNDISGTNYGEFPTLATPEANAEALLAQLQDKGLI
jgi:hypothetical protein